MTTSAIVTDRGRRSPWRRLTVASALSALLSLGFLWQLPGRTNQHAYATLEEASAAPEKGGFELGPLHWDMGLYESAPSLEPLRRFFADGCSGTKGLVAAICVSDRFATAFPHGTPAMEFVNPTYDPARDLAEHMGGAPGHCVTRSGLLSAILLSVGVPARQVQMVGRDRLGHNATEVWEENEGWVLFDPTFGAALDGPANKRSAAAEAYGLGKDNWITAGRRPISAPPGTFMPDPIERSGVTYPDPWLYTRVGARAASWPFRGLFVHVGKVLWDGGPAQGVLRPLALVFALLSVAFGIRGARRDRPASTVVVNDEAQSADRFAA